MTRKLAADRSRRRRSSARSRPGSPSPPAPAASDAPLTGAALERATEAALAHTGGGTVTETEVGDDGAALRGRGHASPTAARSTSAGRGLPGRRQRAGRRRRRRRRGPRGRRLTCARRSAASPRSPLLVVAACGGGERTSPARPRRPRLRKRRPPRRFRRATSRSSSIPADFATTIDNPYWPMTPGTQWVYRETDEDGDRAAGRGHGAPTRRRTIRGHQATRRRTTSSARTASSSRTPSTGTRRTRDGNVWYLGEDTKEYEDGKVVSTASGSWEAGVDGALAGRDRPGRPRARARLPAGVLRGRGRGQRRGPRAWTSRSRCRRHLRRTC